MNRIILITKLFDEENYRGEPTGKKVLLIDHAYEEDTLKPVILPCVHPRFLGAVIDTVINEWVL